MGKESFNDSFKRLEEINTILQSKNFMDIEKLVELQVEANSIFDFCMNTLDKAEVDLSWVSHNRWE